MHSASPHVVTLTARPTRIPPWYAEVEEHSERVASLADRLAQYYGLGHEQRQLIVWAARWHDYGKLALGPGLVNAPRPLSNAEWALMRRHPRIGATYCQRMGAPMAAVRIIDAHHERWDGRGYGEGLARYAIPLGAQIIALADVFDAVTTDRPYRRALSVGAAFDLLRSEREHAFHPDLLDLALNIFSMSAPRLCAMA
ncbi:MAG: HD domain-containing protein [Candidatus Viridilinea halotolerans]|uniref:HD domain-containing protein n=1 Tax=Candidatus Viridilinea halotolerans TaxID=2491704 RepID=A0A426TZ19_9CHLR|nr:MAG: HD domain-containing protein [Candidatus Viridilinea halotolerans]